MSKRIELIWEFLKAARNLVKNKNATKDQIIAFAKQQFDEIPDFLKLQIDNLFRKPKVISTVDEAYKKQLRRLEGYLGSLDRNAPDFQEAADITIKKIEKLKKDYKTGKFVPEGQADVVPIKEGEGIMATDEAKDIKKVIDEKEGDDFINFVRKSGDEEGANKIQKEVDRINKAIDEAEVSGTAKEIVEKRTDDMITGELDSGTGIESLATSMNKLKKKVEELKKISQKTLPGDIMKEIMKGQKVMAEGYKTGNIRTAVRQFMRSEADAGKLKLSKDDEYALSVYGQTTESDPINIFRRYYGEDALESVDEIGDVFRQGESFKHYEELLRQNVDSKILTPKTKGLGDYDPGVLTPKQENELRKQLLKEQDQKKMLEDWDPDREPNADGGLINILKL